MDDSSLSDGTNKLAFSVCETYNNSLEDWTANLIYLKINIFMMLNHQQQGVNPF